MLFKSLELLDGPKELNKFGDSPAEEVELPKDLVRRKLELLSLRHVHQSVLCDLVLLLVGLVQV